MKSHILHRNVNDPPPSTIKSYNTFFENKQRDGTVHSIFDVSSGAGVTGLGNSNEVIQNAMCEAIRTHPYAHSGQWTTPTVEQAGKVIMHHMGPNFEGGGVSFYSGGAEAIEAACKLAMQVSPRSTDKNGLPGFIGRNYAYHGNSMFTLALGGSSRRISLGFAFGVKANVQLVKMYAPHLEMCGDNQTLIDRHSAEALEDLELTLRGNTAYDRRSIVVIDPIGGTAAGISPPHIEYLVKFMELCREHDAIVIFDEILCGNWRTHYFNAWQYYQDRTTVDISPDIVVMGKGISGGYFPISCIVAKHWVRRILETGNSTKLWHTSTNQNHPVGCAAIIAAQQQYREHALLISTLGAALTHTYVPLIRKMHGVASVQGLGSLWGICFSDMHSVSKIAENLFKKGYTCYTDTSRNMLLLAPPFPTTLDTTLEKFIHALDLTIRFS